MSDNDDSIWGSLTDSMLNRATETIDKNEIQDISNPPTDIDTEKDDDDNNDNDDNNDDENDDNNDDIINNQHEWTTMNDSQFITFVNRISQSHALNSTNIIDSSEIQSSPIQLAQNVPDLLSSIPDFDVVLEEELEDADNYAFDDYEGYFDAKNKKQREQGEKLAEFLKQSNDKEYPPLFKNCRIHVNGRTDPDVLQLRKLIVLYGGVYAHYLSSKRSVTHIVAESLPPRKRIQYGNCKVVSPKWITEKNTEIQKGVLPALISDQTTVEESTKEKDIIPSTNEVDELLSQELSRQRIDANHPDFLPMFFAKSRLHHLSTWKSDLQLKFLNKALLKLKSQPTKATNITQRTILHIDFDCFFATVSAKYSNPPIDINTVPCCVTHGGSSADVASCNYVARSFGVKNGMWMSRAKALCPNIVTLPYMFDEYEKTSNLFYEHLMSLEVDSILPVSIDEALLDISSLCEWNKLEDLLHQLKLKLDSITGCSLSLGTGGNVLLAKLALRQAKPNGIFSVHRDHDKIETFLNNIDVQSLPGFGYKLYQKLVPLFDDDNANITIEKLRTLPLAKLTATFGVKMGERLYNYSRGIDDTSIDITADPEKYQRKSLNIDVNWGIRFQNDPEVENFLHRIAGELCKRLLNIDMVGSMLTLKLSVRHPDAPVEPSKYMGMGKCNFYSKSSKLGVATREIGVVSSELKYLWRFMNVSPKELRGIGVGMMKLQKADTAAVNVDNQMKLNFNSKKKVENIIETKPDLKFYEFEEVKENTIQDMISTPKKKRVHETLVNEEIDWEVFNNLPPDLQTEIKNELRRRNLRASPKRTRNKGKNDIANLLSPQKLFPQTSGSNVFQFVSPKKMKELKKTNLIFQGISIRDENGIIDKLLFWMDYTLMDEEPFNESDLTMFNEFMLKLVELNELLLLLRISQVMKSNLNLHTNKLGYLKWKLMLENLVQMVNEQPFTNFEFIF
ncbi:hypothetical protein CANINC_002296 [Pichia inconspicua]|uniref:DNA repair protein REV1 n=1 Tax=Pichia inconspicua TaxID=52247 RepID=A0A4T0X1H7_9ASCO|nr:hypothetical protein CANINC_002296 [[Candida] inconspicua]